MLLLNSLINYNCYFVFKRKVFIINKGLKKKNRRIFFLIAGVFLEQEYLTMIAVWTCIRVRLNW
jgi:hypothetical protein